MSAIHDRVVFLEQQAERDQMRIVELDRLLYEARAIAKIEREVCDAVEACRDSLARRCAEQARHIADLLAMAEEDAAPEPDPIYAAIAVHQRAGQR